VFFLISFLIFEDFFSWCGCRISIFMFRDFKVHKKNKFVFCVFLVCMFSYVRFFLVSILLGAHLVVHDIAVELANLACTQIQHQLIKNWDDLTLKIFRRAILNVLKFSNWQMWKHNNCCIQVLKLEYIKLVITWKFQKFSYKNDLKITNYIKWNFKIYNLKVAQSLKPEHSWPLTLQSHYLWKAPLLYGLQHLAINLALLLKKNCPLHKL
jgi:hypothetical protein